VKLSDGSEPHWPAEPNDDNLHPGKTRFLTASAGSSILIKVTRACGIRESTMGFRTVIERLNETGGLTVIILCNRSDLEPEKLALQVADIFFSIKTDSRSPKAVAQDNPASLPRPFIFVRAAMAPYCFHHRAHLQVLLGTVLTS